MPSAPANKATPNNPFLGKTLGERYRIDKLIGRGGMGLVHLAKESKHGRDVVIKMLAPHWADDKNAIARFEREGLRLAQLTHPNIVELFDIGHEDGQSYIVMEFIRGEPLRRFLGRRGRLSVEEFIPLANQILSAVGYAHSRSMMLRDIKPSNIMLTEHLDKANFVKMLDFGLAKLVDGDDVEITKAHVIGTAGYLAPEQIKGEDVDVRVDVYALGILFFVMLTGKSPILGENDGAVLYNHVHGEPLKLGSLLPNDHDVPQPLMDLIHRCMDKDPNQRPKDASEAADELQKCVPAEMFGLPDATADTRKAIDDYWEQKFNPKDEEEDEDATSAEWTRPHLRKLLAAGGKDPKAGQQDRPPQPPKHMRRSKSKSKSTAKTKTDGMAKTRPPKPKPKRTPKEKTRVGLPATGSAPVVETGPPKRRPPPAKTAARARMDAPTQMMESGGKPEVGEPHSSETLLGAPRPPSLPKPRPRKPPPVPTARPMPKSLQPKTPRPKPSLPPPKSLTPKRPHSPAAPPPQAKTDEAGTPEALPSATLKQPVHEPKVDPALLSQSLQVAAAPTPAPIVAESTFELEEPVAAPQRPVAAIIVVAVILATALGGMVAYVMFGDDEPKTTVAEASSADAAATIKAPPVEKDPEDEPEAKDEPESPADDAIALADAEPPSGDTVEGTLPIKGPKGAKLYVDGEAYGELPTDAALPPGKHTLSVEADGYLPWETEVDVVEGDNPALVAQLEVATEDSPKVKVSSRKHYGKKGRNNSNSEPAPKSEPPRKTPDPITDSKPAPKPKPEPPPEPKPEPKKNKKKSNEDVFIKPGSKGRTKDDGIFLPVGK